MLFFEVSQKQVKCFAELTEQTDNYLQKHTGNTLKTSRADKIFQISQTKLRSIIIKILQEYSCQWLTIACLHRLA